jgi:hypothetical protein
MSAKLLPMAIALCLPYPLTYPLILYFPRQLRGPISQIPCHPDFFQPLFEYYYLITQINTKLTCWLSNFLIRFNAILGKQLLKDNMAADDVRARYQIDKGDTENLHHVLAIETFRRVSQLTSLISWSPADYVPLKGQLRLSHNFSEVVISDFNSSVYGIIQSVMDEILVFGSAPEMIIRQFGTLLEDAKEICSPTALSRIIPSPRLY